MMIPTWSVYGIAPKADGEKYLSMLMVDEAVYVATLNWSGLEADAGEAMAQLLDKGSAELHREAQMLRMGGASVRMLLEREACR